MGFQQLTANITFFWPARKYFVEAFGKLLPGGNGNAKQLLQETQHLRPPRELVQEHRIAPGSIDLEGGVHDIDLTEAPSEASDVMLFLCRISPTSPTSIKIKDISDIMEITWFSYLAVICYSWKEIQMLKNDFSGDELAKRLVKPFWVTGTTDHEQWAYMPCGFGLP